MIVWLWDHEILGLILYSKFIRFIHLMTTETNRKIEHLNLINISCIIEYHWLKANAHYD